MTNSKPTLAVVIPAHNEERHIKACLQSLNDQICPVDEITVVINCSSDSTFEIASSFKNVKVINVDKKGLINARNIGFNSTNCDIIARLNADVICSPDWSKKIVETFKNPAISALAGVAITKSLPFWPYIYSTFWSRAYLLYAESYFGIPILWGANMVLKREAWESIATSACLLDNEVHEDQDLSIHLAQQNRTIVKKSDFIVTTQEISYFNWKKLNYYNQLKIRTKKTHFDFIKSSDRRYRLLTRIAKSLLVILPGTVFFVSSLFGLFIEKITSGSN